jgi:hypothetical protein
LSELGFLGLEDDRINVFGIDQKWILMEAEVWDFKRMIL